MNQILLVGHGSLPVALKESVQMIMGPCEGIHTVSLSPDDGREDLERKLAGLDGDLPEGGGLTVLTDVIGGSPCTAALERYAENPQVDVIAGMNLPMVLTAALEGKAGRELIEEGRASVVDAKSLAAGEAEPPAVGEEALPNDPGNPHTIVGVRIDARGIHGQVAATWIPSTDATRVVLIDDQVVGNKVQKTALRMACPEHVKLSILSVERAARRLADPGSYPGERVFVVLPRVETLSALMDRGLVFEVVNMGNVPNRPGTVSYAKTVYLTDAERDAVRKVMGAGTSFTVRQVPNDPVVEFALGDREEA